MVQIRKNKQTHLTGHVMTMVLLRTGLPATVTTTDGLCIFVAWPKEAAS
jgi:hypothetical protein